MSGSQNSISHRSVTVTILALVAGYGLAIVFGLMPTELPQSHAPTGGTEKPHSPAQHSEESPDSPRSPDAPHASAYAPTPAHVLPFIGLLGAIAVFPLLPATQHWWESNLHRFYMAVGMSLITLLLYRWGAGDWGRVVQVLDHALLQEYLPFIVLLFSLYSISGGIRVEGDLQASPRVNAMFMTVGALLASFVGTTGAAMLLIRPLLETNRERKQVQHTVVFFIFIVCNCGGLLLPIGDPPLFLGYLEGVSFLWTLWRLCLPWLFVNVTLIVMYYLADTWIFLPRETQSDLRRDETQIRPLRIHGLMPNAWLLGAVVICVALLDPHKAFPGTQWHAWPYLREALLLSLVAISLAWGAESIRTANQFNFSAIIEVAALFVGIFICMQPALEILNERGPSLGMNTPHKLFGISGLLSSVLDNAPTYLVFFRTAAAQFGGVSHFVELVSRTDTAEAREACSMLAGISMGSVFMGAMTYIGNGPNFMVRAIAEQSGVKMPSFFGYTLWYAIPLLLPVLLASAVMFL